MQMRLFFSGGFFRLLSILLAVVMAVGPTTNVLAQGAVQAVRQRAENLGAGATQPLREPVPDNIERALAGPAAGTIDTTYVSPGAMAVVVLRPAQLMSAPVTEMLPREVATAAGLKYLGFDPADVDEVIAFADMTNPLAPGYGLTIKFNKPFKGSSIPAELRAHAQLAELGGKKYLQAGGQNPMLPSFYGPNNQTLVIAPDATLRQLVAGGQAAKSGPMLDRLRDVPGGSDLYAVVDMTMVRPMIQMAVAQAPPIPPEMQPLLEAPNHMSAAELTVNLTTSGPTSLIVHANDEASAQRLEELIAELSRKQQEQIRAQFAQLAASNDPVERALAQYMERISSSWNKPLAPTREGATLTMFRTELGASQNPMVTAAIGGILVALLLPAVQAAREAARRNQSMNNLKHMVLGLLNYHDTKGTFPAHASYNAEGQPLLSWRVHILPFMEENALYQQFHLDEPWDSEHNKQLIAQMPEVFKCPGLALEPGKTNYLAVVGEQCTFNGTKDGLRLQNITDGTSKTIAIVEADAAEAVEWTKPDDFEFNAENPNAGLGNLRPGGWNAAFCDGSVRFISNTVDLGILKALFTANGGEAIGAF
jgi:hypothetical protein